MTLLRIGARRSPLAVAQARLVADALASRGRPSQIVGITTHGDVDHRDLTVIGGTGVFAGAVRQALRDDEIDLAVHSAKDLPTAAEPDLEVVAYPVRDDPRDVLIGCRLADLRTGQSVATGSPRRASQLAAWAARRGIRLDIQPLRGNVDSRIAKVRDGMCSAIVLAASGLRRLGRLNADGNAVGDLPAEILAPAVMLPAAAQGALAIEARSDTPSAAVGAELDDPETRARVLAERAVLARLEQGCTAPVGALANVRSSHDMGQDLTMTAVIGRTDTSRFDQAGSNDQLLRVEGAGSMSDATTLGFRLAGELLARLDSPTS